MRAGHEVSLVVTQPDRPKGRGMELALSPVKQKAIELGLPIAQPEKIKNNQEFRAQLESACARVHCDCRLWAHHSALDARSAGASATSTCTPRCCRSIAEPRRFSGRLHQGEQVTGNTTMRIDEGLDTGDILLQREMEISSGGYQRDAGSAAGGDGRGVAGGNLAGHSAEEPAAQRRRINARATLAPILTREDGRIDFSRDTAQTICNRYRGFQPWPGAFTTFRGKQLTLHASAVAAAGARALVAGEIAVAGEQLLVGCGEGTAIAIDELQLEGKRRMSAREFINGYQPKAGEKMGS